MTVKAELPPSDARSADARALLRRLAGPAGLQASLDADATPEYRAVFTRDAIMAGLAGLLLDDDVVVAGLGRTLAGLRDRLGPQGQVPSNFRTAPDGAAHVSFGTLAPRVDAASWFLLGAGLAVRAGAAPPDPFREPVSRVAGLLDALEYNGRHLVHLPAGANWADEYVTEGCTLSDQALRAWGLRACGEAFDRPAWVAKAAAIGDAVAERFRDPEAAPPAWPFADIRPVGVRRALDLAGCALLGAGGVAPTLADDALDAIAARFLDAGRLPPAFHPVIREGDPDWPALRRYHLHAFRNHPHEYHNGGVWPVWLGWLALAYAARGRGAALGRLRRLVADALDEAPGFAHHEFLHGETLAPMGNRDMAYTATGIAFLAVAGTPAQGRILR